MFGTNYIIDNDKEGIAPNPTFYKEIYTTSNNHKLYQNLYPTSIGFAVNSDLSQKDIWKYNSFSPAHNQNNFFKLTTGRDDVLEAVNFTSVSAKNMDISFDKNDKSQIIKYSLHKDKIAEAEINISTKIKETGRYYVTMTPTTTQMDFNLFVDVNNKSFKALHEKQTYGATIDVGYIEAGETINAKLVPNLFFLKSDTEQISYFVYRVNEEAVKDAYATLKENGIIDVIDYSDNSYSFKINNKTEFIYLSIPYDKNWVITMDNENLEYDKEIFKIADGLIGLKIPVGNHEVKMVYKNQYILPGFCITTFALILFIVLEIRKKKKEDLIITQTSNTEPINLETTNIELVDTYNTDIKISENIST